MKSLVATLGLVVLIGAGCSNAASVDVTLEAGDTLMVRQTVLGIGGKLTELVGVAQEERVVTIPDPWSSYSTGLEDDTFILLPLETYAELAGTGTTHISLGLYDQTISDALGMFDRINVIMEFIGGSSAVGTQQDVLLVTVTDADATDWVRLNGELVQVKTIEASNLFASYVILANPESPVILSLTLKPAARAQFDALASFEGFEVAEIKKAGE